MSGRRARRGVAVRGGSGRGGRDGAAKPVTQSQPPDQTTEAAEDTAPAEINVSQEEFTDTSIVEEMKDKNVDDGEAEEGNADKAEGNADEAEGNANEAEGNADEAEGNADEAEGNMDEAEGNMDEAEGNMDEAEGIMDEAEGNSEVIDVDMEEETEQEVVIVNDGSKDDKKKADSGQENGGKKGDKKKDDKWVLEVPKVDLVDIPPYDPQSVREKFKWTIRIYPVSVDDAMLSGLPAMTKVQDAFIHINRRDPKQGQMEFGMTKTPDAIVMMLRILRTPLVNGMVTIEVVKRGKPRRDTAHSDGGDAESADKEAEVEEDGMKDTGPEAKDEADMQSGNGPKQPGGKIPYHALPWSVVMDKAVFMVDLAKAQKIKFVKHVKGDIRRRAVFVGNMPRGCTEELFKVIFPMANGILFRATDDPHKRKAFIETCHRFNAMGFVQSYPALRINDVDFKLSLEEDELEKLVVSEDASRSEPSTGDGEKTREEQPVKVEEEEKVKKEEEKKGETKTPENEKKEDGKDKQNGEKKTQVSSKPPHVLAKRKQKRKRDFQDEIQREWHSQITSPRGQQASQQGNRGRGGSAGQSPRGSMTRGGVGSRGRVEVETRGGMRDRVGPGGRSGLGGREGMGGRRTMDVNRSLGAMRAGAGIMGQAPQPPMSNLEGKIQNLMRLQNQLELTIHNQMNYLDQAQQTRQQLAMSGLSALAVGNVGGGMSLGDQRAANLNTSGFGSQASDRNKSRWRNRNRNKQGGKGGGNNQGSVRSSGDGGKGGGNNQRSSRAVGRDGRDQHRLSGGQQGGRFSSPSGENPSPNKRFRKDSTGNAGVGGNRFGGGDDRFGRNDLGRDIGSFGERDSFVRSSLGGGADSLGIGSQSSFIERDRYRGDGGEYSSGNLNTSWGAGSSRDYGLRDSVGGVGYSSSSYSGAGYSGLSGRDSYLGSMSRDYGGGSLSSSYLDDYARPSLSTYSDNQNLLGGSALGSSYNRY